MAKTFIFHGFRGSWWICTTKYLHPQFSPWLPARDEVCRPMTQPMYFGGPGQARGYMRWGASLSQGKGYIPPLKKKEMFMGVMFGLNFWKLGIKGSLEVNASDMERWKAEKRRVVWNKGSCSGCSEVDCSDFGHGWTWHVWCIAIVLTHFPRQQMSYGSYLLMSLHLYTVPGCDY